MEWEGVGVERGGDRMGGSWWRWNGRELVEMEWEGVGVERGGGDGMGGSWCRERRRWNGRELV